MRFYKYIENYNEYFYISYLCLIVLMYTLESINISFNAIIHDIILFLSLLFLGLYALTSYSKYNNILIRSLFVFIAILYYLITKETVFSIVILTVVLSNKINIMYVMKILAIEKLILLITSTILSILHFIPFTIIQSERGIRYAFGYSHPNILALEAFIILLLFYMIIDNKLNFIKKNIIFLILSIAVYYFTQTRTTFVLSIVTIILFCCLKLNNKKIFNLLRYVPILCFVFSIFFSWAFTLKINNFFFQNILESIDSLFSHRFLLGSICFNEFPISIFGGNLNLDILSSKYSYPIIDNGYIYILFSFGILSCIILLLWYTYTLNYFIEKQNYKFAIFISIFLIVAISENILRSLSINFSVLFCSVFFNSFNLDNYLKNKFVHSNKLRRITNHDT